MVQDLIVAQAQKTKCNNHCFDNHQHEKYEIFFFSRPKDKTFRWKFEGDDTVKLSSTNGLYAVCQCDFFLCHKKYFLIIRSR